MCSGKIATSLITGQVLYTDKPVSVDVDDRLGRWPECVAPVVVGVEWRREWESEVKDDGTYIQYMYVRGPWAWHRTSVDGLKIVHKWVPI